MAFSFSLVQGYCTYLYIVQNWIRNQNIRDKKIHCKLHESTELHIRCKYYIRVGQTKEGFVVFGVQKKVKVLLLVHLTH